MSTFFEQTTDTLPRIPLIKAVELNPKLARGSLNDDVEVSFVPMAAVEAGSGRINTAEVRKYADVKKGYTFFREGDVLFAKITPCMENGKMAVASHLRNGIGFGSTEFHVLRPREGVDARYIYYFVASSSFRGEAAHHMTGAVGQKRVPVSFLEHSEIPLPSLEHQQLIVAEIERQFSRLDEAVAGLKRIKANLKRYKAAVLKAAVEGKLTEEWRKVHPNVESGAELLKRILAERKKKWEEKNPGKEYKEPAAPDTSSLPELPEGWVWATAEQISDFVTKGTTPAASKLADGSGEVQFLKVYNLTFDGKLNYKYKPVFVSRSTHEGELARSIVHSGDVLINIVGPPLGQVSIVPPIIPEANINQAIARFRPLDGVLKEYLQCTLMASEIMGWAIKRAKTTAGQANLTLELCRALPVPLPPLVEQGEIANEVARVLSAAEENETVTNGSLQRTARLRQGILKRAFRGELNARVEHRNGGATHNAND